MELEVRSIKKIVVDEILNEILNDKSIKISEQDIADKLAKKVA